MNLLASNQKQGVTQAKWAGELDAAKLKVNRQTAHVSPGEMVWVVVLVLLPLGMRSEHEIRLNQVAFLSSSHRH